jgi:23S rRNA pseudouridine1911/1915/1917 synthase
MRVSDINGKKAITNYKTIKVFNVKNIPKISLIECELETGRTHQIRVHLKYKGASLLGDKQYGKKNIKFKKINEEFFVKLNKLTGQALHAKTLEFVHPKTKKLMNFNSDLPKEFKNILSLLENLNS